MRSNIGGVFAAPILTCAALLSAGNTCAESTLPDGDARLLVESVCASCHATTYITSSAGYDLATWRRLIDSMVQLAPAQAESVSAYLAEHFPPDPERRPTLVEGPVQIEIEEWVTPTRGQRSRDPAEAPDGSIWWTGMLASILGRFDPDTGAMDEYHLPPAARPHSIVPDEDGMIWYTGNSNATIGKLDPATGLVTEYPTQSRDPHTAVFHPNGKLYFTAQRASMIGRLDPETGEVDEIETRSRPYGIKVGPQGKLWIAFNGTNAIASMDPDSMLFEYYDIPDQDTRIRRLDIDSQGRIWYVNSSMGRLGVLDPDSGESREWPSPSGPKSHPYSIEIIDDIVWYNESGMRPDALVRFDPATETFQSWAIPSGVGIVHHVWETRDGDLLIHQSSINRIGRVRITAESN